MQHGSLGLWYRKQHWAISPKSKLDKEIRLLIFSSTNGVRWSQNADSMQPSCSLSACQKVLSDILWKKRTAEDRDWLDPFRRDKSCIHCLKELNSQIKTVALKSTADGVCVSLRNLAQIFLCLPFCLSVLNTVLELYCGLRAIHGAATTMSNNSREILRNAFLISNYTIKQFNKKHERNQLSIKVFLVRQLETSNTSNELKLLEIISPDVTKHIAVGGTKTTHTSI